MQGPFTEKYSHGATLGELIISSIPVLNVVPLAVSVGEAIENRQWNQLGEMAGSLVAGSAIGCGVAKYGGYGLRFTVNDIGATGVGRYQAGSVGLGIERGVPNSGGVLPEQEVGSPYFLWIDPISVQCPMSIDTVAYQIGERTMNGGVRNARQLGKVFLLNTMTSPVSSLVELADSFDIFVILSANLYQISDLHDGNSEEAEREMTKRCRSLLCSVSQIDCWKSKAAEITC